MKLRIDRVRMAMPGCFYSYDVAVPKVKGADCVLTICRDGKEYVSFTDATIGADHWKMEKGWDRYEAYQAHEKTANAKAWQAVQKAFPETAGSGYHSLFFEIPGFDARHDTVYIDA